MVNGKATRVAVTALVLVETIRELGKVPSGHLYAGVMEHVSVDIYEGAVQTLVNAGLVTRSRSHLLRWVGRTFPGSETRREPGAGKPPAATGGQPEGGV